MKTSLRSGVLGLPSVLGLGMLVACGGGKPARDDANVDEGLNGSTRSDVAGGETSEFSGGDIGLCPEIVSDTPLDLANGEVAGWAALAAGHHDVSMVWKREFLSDDVTGFEEHTQLTLDVTVLAGRELTYGTGGFDSYELDGACDGTMARQLELEVTLETADGALAGSFRHWVEPAPDFYNPGGWVLSSAQVRERNDGYDTSSFTGALELGLDPELGGTDELGVWLQFDAESARGFFAPRVTLPPDAAGEYNQTWSPLSGSFPDDGCDVYLRAVPLDAVYAELGDTPRAAFEASMLQQPRTIAAAWEAPGPGGTDPGSAATLSWTQVTLRAGSPSLACQGYGGSEGLYIHAPVSIETADGRVNLTQGATFYMSAGSKYVSSQSAWIPSAGFESATGMRIEFGADEYGSIDLNHWSNDGRVEGNLNVLGWRDFASQYPARSTLRWCAGPKCEEMWCIITATDLAAECGIDE